VKVEGRVEKGRKIIKTIAISSLILILGIFLLLFVVKGSFMPKTYLAPWSKDYYKKFDDARMQLISHGLLAPNAHNMQSWRIVLDKDNNLKFKIYLDEKRLLPETDPFHRQSVISQGTFLELVDIAAKKLGYEAVIKIYPEGEISKKPAPDEIHNIPTAEVSLSKKDNNKSSRYDAIFDRVTTRTNYLDKPLTKEQIDQIMSLDDYKDIGVVVFQATEELKYLKNLTTEGVSIESKKESTMNESHIVIRFSEYQKNKYKYGLTMTSQGFPKTKLFFLESLGSLFPITLEQEGKIWREAETERIQKTPAYIMIFSDNNDRTTQVKVGMLYARIQLEGTTLGLSMQPTMQITQEYPEMKDLYEKVVQKFVKNGQTVQMLFRVGEAEKQVEHSPRRDVLELIH